MAFYLVPPVVAFAAALIAYNATGRWLRLAALGVLVAVLGLICLGAAKLLAVNRHIDLCMDQTAWYFKENNRFHPDCGDPNVKW